MAIGIDIQTRFQSVADARKQVEMLGTSLQDVQGLTDLGNMGFEPSQTERVKELVQQVNRLNTISNVGERRGGLLDAKQFAEAQRLMQQLTRGVQDYGKEIDKLKQKHAEMLREERQIQDRIATGRATPQDRARRQELRQEQGTTGDEIDRLQRDEARIQRVRQDTMHASQQIGNMQQQEQNSTASTLKKALGWGLAAAGGFSILGFLSQSRAKYQQSVGQAAELHARGIQGADGGVGMGYGPLEYQGLLGNLSQTTGVSGDAAQRKAYSTALFARSQGVDINQASALHGQVYQATGNNNLSNNMMIGLTSTGIDKSKMPELLQQIAKNTQVMSSAQGGAGLTQDMMLMSAYAAVQAMKQGDKEGAVFAKSGEFANFMTNGMQDAGTPAGNLMLFQALGGFEGEMGYGKIHQMNKIKSEGFWNNMDVFDKLMMNAPKLRGEKGSEEYQNSLNERAGWMETYFQGTMKMSPRATELLAESMGKGGILEGFSGNKEDMVKKLNTIIASGGTDGQRAKELKAEIDKNPEMDKLNREARREQLHIEAGEKLNRMLGSLEDAVLGITTSILGTQTAERLIETVDNLGNTLQTLIKWIENPTEMASKQAAQSVADTAKSGLETALTAPRQALQLAGWEPPAASRLGSKTQYDTIFQDASTRYKVDAPMLKAVARAESGLNNKAVSPVGAQGIMQLMPDTAKGLGVTDAFDPTQNIMGGSKYLSQLLKKYKQPETALAAYNWGPGKVDRLLKTNKQKALDSKTIQLLPTETKKYIRKVTQNYQQESGIAVPADSPVHSLPIYEGMSHGKRGGFAKQLPTKQTDASQYKVEKPTVKNTTNTTDMTGGSTADQQAKPTDMTTTNGLLSQIKELIARQQAILHPQATAASTK